MIDILIPTFNRSKFLIKNLVELTDQLQSEGLLCHYRILISDNASTDDTFSAICEFNDNVEKKVTVFQQKANVGLERNALFLLSKATSQFVMYLGDDDFLPPGYLAYVYETVLRGETGCIVPGITNLFPDGSTSPARCFDYDIKEFCPGFETVCEVSHLGHQLSGLVIEREELYDRYSKNPDLNNIYPFIFFVGYVSLNRKLSFAPKFKVLVTQGNVKDWKYDDSGLLLEIFKNYKLLFYNEDQKFRASCISFVKHQTWRLRLGVNPGPSIRALYHLMRKGSYLGFVLKTQLVLTLPYLYARAIIRRLRLN